MGKGENGAAFFILSYYGFYSVQYFIKAFTTLEATL